MTAQDADAVRRAYQAFNEQDIPTLVASFSPDAVWHTSGRNVLAGDYHGVEAVLNFFGTIAALSGGTFRAELQDVVSGEGDTVAVHIGRAQRGGRTLEDHNVLIFRMSDGVAVEVWEHHRDQHAVDEFWGPAAQ